MQRIHFGAADLARVRLKTSAGPLAETAFAYGLMGRGVTPAFARWRARVDEQLARRPIPLPGGGDTPDLNAMLRLVEQADRGVAELRASGYLSRLWRTAVAPYWDRIRAYLEAECDARGRVAMAGGAELLLDTLHSKSTWRAGVLHIPGAPDEDLRLEGRGLVLAPSVFLGHRPGRVTRNPAGGGPVVLAFAAPPDVNQAASLWDEPADTQGSLGALVGQTRAAALQVLRTSRTTSQLASDLGISAAGASQHTAVLRQTGLITTRRVRNTVLHSLTPLGMALLTGMGTPPARAAAWEAGTPGPARAFAGRAHVR
jgi:DNA-binding transcriptional ArsR family regulator